MNNKIGEWFAELFNERFNSNITVGYYSGTWTLGVPGKKFNLKMPSYNNWNHFNIYSDRRSSFVSIECIKLPKYNFKDVFCPNLEHNYLEIFEANEGNHIEINYDVVGLTFWALNRLEEIEVKQVDEHGRFPDNCAVSVKYGADDRPFVDEWLCVIFELMKTYSKEFKGAFPKSNLALSHDIDIVSEFKFRPWYFCLKLTLKRMIEEKSMGALKELLVQKVFGTGAISAFDRYNTFSFLMDVADKLQVRSVFYWIPKKDGTQYSADYDIHHPFVGEIIKEVSVRGHLNGVHPSYKSLDKENGILKDVLELRHALSRNSIVQDSLALRMHYLRWDVKKSWREIELSGSTLDATLGFAKINGFRCGTCFCYKPLDIKTGRILPFKVEPLIFMDDTSLNRIMCDLTLKKELDKAKTLHTRISDVGGVFSILWHNNNLINKKHRELYFGILEIISES